MESNRYALMPTGQDPLFFRGRRIAQLMVVPDDHHGYYARRFLDIEIYETDKSRFISVVRYGCVTEGRADPDMPFCDVQVFKDRQKMEEYLRAYDFAAHLELSLTPDGHSCLTGMIEDYCSDFESRCREAVDTLLDAVPVA